MGSALSRKLRAFLARNERRILIVGLDNAGKTSALRVRAPLAGWHALLATDATHSHSPTVHAPHSGALSAAGGAPREDRPDGRV